MTDAWGYVRLSQEGDASLEEQKESIREYARKHDLNLQTTRNDGQRTSGFNVDRDEYQLLRGKIERGEIDAVITRDRARLARDFDERLWLITAFRETGIEWHVTEVGDRLYLEDVQSAGFEAVHAMMDHVKKMTEIERSRKVVKDRLERGCYQGRPPIGLEFADDGCLLERSDRWSDVMDAFDMIEDGATKTAIIEETGLSKHHIDQFRDDRDRDWYAEIVADYVDDD